MTSNDVVACLRDAGLDISANPGSKRDLARIQGQFNAWAAETGLSFTHLSRICAMSTGENYDAETLRSRGGGTNRSTGSRARKIDVSSPEMLPPPIEHDRLQPTGQPQQALPGRQMQPFKRVANRVALDHAAFHHHGLGRPQPALPFSKLISGRMRA